MNRTFIAALTGLLVAVLSPSCLSTCGCGTAHADSVCYGQHVPICSLGMTPTCICTGHTGQDCRYICVPKQ